MRKTLLVLGLAACASSPPHPPPPAAATPAAAAAATRTIRRTILSVGKPIGSSVVTIAADGTISNVLDIHDNGRGPHADATMRLHPDGTLAFLEVRGHTEMGAPVSERFTLEKGHASWKSTDEQGEKDVAGPAFFIPNSSADADAFLLEALRRNGNRLEALPGGTARLETVGDATVAIAGKDTRLVLHAITGLTTTPSYIWAREDGSYFAVVSPGFWFGEEGAESVGETLAARQEELRKERERKIAEQLRHAPPPAGVALKNARVLDVERGVWRGDHTVLIVGDRIRAVGPSRSVKIPAGAEVVDLGGKALLPGLWDMHAHLGPADGPLNIAAGVTSARDVGNIADRLDDLKKQWDEGAGVGPHVYRAGFIEGRGKDAATTEITATNEAEARAGVEFFAKRGYEMIKIYNSIDPKLVPVIAAAAHERGMGVTGHIPAHMLANEAVRAGYDGIEHINQMMLNFFADHDTDTRTLLRFTLVGDRAAEFDAQSPASRDFVALLRKHKTVLDPTYVTFEPVWVAEQGKVVPGWEAIAPRLPVQQQRSLLVGGLPLEGKKELYARSWQKMLSMAKVWHDAGVTLVTGTDFIAGFSLHRELELFVQGGLLPIDALRAATVVPARVMKAAAHTGSIAPGKIADLVVVDGDPLASISDVRKTVMTFRAGVRYAADELLESVSVKPR